MPGSITSRSTRNAMSLEELSALVRIEPGQLAEWS
jgi:hypothetical protein